MTPKFLTRLFDALEDAWGHNWSQSAINERLDRPDGSGDRRWWKGWNPAQAAQRPPGTDKADRRPDGAKSRRWSTQALNERLDASRRRRP